MYNAIRTRLFGNSSGRQVVLRFMADFVTANVVLVAVGVLRVLVSGQLDLADPVGQVMAKCNPVYILHAGWFAATAVLLFAFAGLYRPVPSSRIGQRLLDVTGACAVGFSGAGDACRPIRSRKSRSSSEEHPELNFRPKYLPSFSAASTARANCVALETSASS